jgi:hypothetical protein
MKKQAQILALGTLCVFFALPQQARAQAEDAPRYEVGGQFSILRRREPSTDTRPGFGGRFTVNLTDNVAAEAQVDFYPGESPFKGGRMTSGLFGFKAGKRYQRFGIYAKARPGFVHFSRAFAGFTEVPTTGNPPSSFFEPQFRGQTEFAVDLGGVVEFYPTRRIVTRFDVGDTIIRYKERTTNVVVVNNGLLPFTQPGETRHNIQFSAGIGFRF